jgi:hypothetical protein
MDGKRDSPFESIVQVFSYGGGSDDNDDDDDDDDDDDNNE